MILKRTITFLLGAGLLAVVVWSGFRTTNGTAYVVWFGLASAILAPTGLALIGYTLTGGQREVLQRLSKIPEIDKLISEAQTQEERIRLLEGERARLLEAVKLETRRQTLITKKYTLEQDGTRILNELQAVNLELAGLEMDVEASTVKEEVARLNEQLQARRRGDVVIRLGETYIRVSRELIRSVPLYPLLLLPGFFAEATFRFVEVFSEGIRRFIVVLGEALARFPGALANSLNNIVNIFRRR